MRMHTTELKGARSRNLIAPPEDITKYGQTFSESKCSRFWGVPTLEETFLAGPAFRKTSERRDERHVREYEHLDGLSQHSV